MITFPDDVLASYDRSKNYIRKTPLDHSPSLSELINGEVYLKLENVQKTGSFKFRGAISKITSLSSDQRNKGVVTASTANPAPASKPIDWYNLLPHNIPVTMRKYALNNLDYNIKVKEIINRLKEC